MLRGIVVIFAASLYMAAASCPGLDKMPNFNITSFLGTWYEQGNFNSMRDNIKGNPNCRTTLYEIDSNGNYRVLDKTTETYVNYRGETRKRVVNAIGWPTFNINSQDFETVRVNNRRDYDYGALASYGFYVLDTDYKNYVIIATCSRYFDSITILTRAKQIPNTKEMQETNNKIEASLQKYGLNQCDFKFVSNECTASYSS